MFRYTQVTRHMSSRFVVCRAAPEFVLRHLDVLLTRGQSFIAGLLACVSKVGKVCASRSSAAVGARMWGSNFAACFARVNILC
jgi:hypothetical protein